MEKEKQFKSFSDFTNLYEFSKTLRFELRPVGNTQKMLDEADVFGKDKIIQEKYQKTKPFIDRLHREFVNESLEGVLLTELKKYFNALQGWENNKKDKEMQKLFKKEEERLRKEIVGFFEKNAKNWAEKKYANLGLKNKDIGILFEEGVFDLLKKRYGNENESFLTGKDGIFVKGEDGEQISIFDEWKKGFVGYFTKFQQTRKNFYTGDGSETAIATRVIDQNLKRFCDNFEDFKKIKNKIADFSEIEKNFNKPIGQVFSLDFYNQCLLQKGIDAYNEIIGGKTLNNGKKLRGVNELINEYRQKNKGEKAPFLKLLDKQILSEKEKFAIGIESDERLFETLSLFYKTAEEKTAIVKKLFFDFISNYKNYDLSKIYISKEALNTIAYKWASDTIKFEEYIFEIINKKEVRDWYDLFRNSKIGKDENGYKFPNFITLRHIKEGLEKVNGERLWKEKYYNNEEDKKDKGFLAEKELAFEQFLRIFNFEFSSLFESEFMDEEGEIIKTGYDFFKKDFEKLINSKDFFIDPESKIIIKNFADSVLRIYQMAKYFAVEKKRSWIDGYGLDDFYTNPNYGYLKFYENAYSGIVQVYNDIRNYLTKKPYSEEKWKLNFECGHLLGGWSSEFNTSSALIFEKKGDFYLGVVNKLTDDKRKKLTENINKNNLCKKMIYDFQKPDNKNVPRLFIRSKGENFSPAVEELNLPVRSIIDIYDRGLFQTENKNNPNFKDSLRKLIDYFKLGFSRHGSYKHFNFKWKESCDYNNIAEFYQDTIRSCYEIKWENINFDEIIKLTESKDIYLFQIYNKDFSKKSTGKSNLHTSYFKALFLDKNLENNGGVILKLSGGGEIFYRPKTNQEKLGLRQNKHGGALKYENKDGEVKDVIKNRRYAENKIFLHFPIQLNYARNINKFDQKINNFLADNKDINIIGIDRGEKHLAYYSIIDQNGKIIKSDSLNTVKGIEYASKLEQKANERESARRDWQEVEGIKDMKKGYISQIVRELADLAIKHNAIIVLEDLNMRFKQIRGGIEKSIYQQLEKALIDKLSFLVNKGEKNPEKAGHLLKAYQLTAPFESFKDMGKQTGIIFYTQASYTSKTCPKCGFRKNNNKFYFENITKAGDVLGKLKYFEFNNKKQCFDLNYSLNDFLSNEEIERNKKKNRNNILFSDVKKKDLFNLSTKDGIRYKWHNKNTERAKKEFPGEKKYSENGNGVVKEYDITKCLMSLFDGKEAKKNDLDYRHNLLEKLTSGEWSSDFYKGLFYYLNLLFEIRNSISGTDIDYISCPQCDFHSNKKSSDIENGDANGAYNIARKGIIILEKIKQFKKNNGGLERISWSDLFIDLEEWDKFTQSVDKE